MKEYTPTTHVFTNHDTTVQQYEHDNPVIEDPLELLLALEEVAIRLYAIHPLDDMTQQEFISFYTTTKLEEIM